jgi:WS/DGAT/MGAT family acyltransferase
MQQLSGLDASFLYLETPRNPMHVSGFGLYDPSTSKDGQVSFERILKNTEQRLHLARCFRQKLAHVPLDLDHPWWVEDERFDLEFHVRHIALPPPGDWRQLCTQAARLHSRPLDLTRPLWEMYLIEGLGRIPGAPPGSYAVFTKIHHAAIDGVSGVELTAAIHDLEPDAHPPAPAKGWKPEPEPRARDLLARAAGHTARNPFRLAGLVGRTLPALARARRELRARGDQEAAVGPVPRTRFNGLVTPHRVMGGVLLDLGVIREIRKTATGATVNDVILTICGGALRKYLEGKRELPKDSLVAMAPISVRTERERGTAGNQVSMMNLSVRSDVEDPAERLRAVFQGTQRSKALTNAIGARLLTDYTHFVPGMLAGLGMRAYTRFGLAERHTPLFNVVVTNVPGPQVPLYSAGARMLASYTAGPVLDGMGLIMPVLSYCGEVTVSFASCREMLPDPEFFEDCLRESYDDLKAATLGAEGPGEG